MTLEEQFALLVANVSAERVRPIPNIMQPISKPALTRTRTVYSVGEALTVKGASNAKLGAGTFRNSGT